MSIDAALITALRTDGGVSTLVTGRVFVFGGRQGAAYPYITIQRISTQGAAYLDGPSSLDWPLFQIDVWAEKAADALAVGEAIRTAIDGRQSTGFYATFQNQRGPAPDEDTRNFRVSQDYLLFYERN